jgi:hypothetical protein
MPALAALGFDGRQHAPDEHLLRPVAREALQLMAGLWWVLGEAALRLQRQAAVPALSRRSRVPA